MPSPLIHLSDLKRPETVDTATGLSMPSPSEGLSAFGSSLPELQRCIGNLQVNQCLHFVSRGSWSSHLLLRFLLEKFGSAHLLMTTWSLTEEPLRSMVMMKDQGLLKSARCILSERISERTPGVMQFAEQFFDELKLMRLHAKVTVLMGDDWGVSVVSSANFTRNPRIEAGVIDTHAPIAQFHQNWILDELRNVD